jgi:hypothetical protein
MRQKKKTRQNDELAQGKIKPHQEVSWKLLIKERELLDQKQELERKRRKKEQQQSDHLQEQARKQQQKEQQQLEQKRRLEK